LSPGERYYEPVDPRFTIGREAAEAIRQANTFREMREASVGASQTTNQMSQSMDNLGGAEVECFNDCDGWEPSWAIRDDAYIDDRTMREILRGDDSSD